MKKKKLALLGYGYLNQVIARSVKDGVLSEYELVGVLGRNPARTQRFADYFNCTPCTNIEQFMALQPDFVSEAASPQAVVDYTETILQGGSHMIVLSTSAFADVALYERFVDVASQNNTQIYIAGGATGAFNLLQTALYMSKTPIDVTITSKKPPQFVAYTPFNREGILGITEPERVYTGTAKEIIDIYPYVFNVIYATALASAGPEETKFNIDAVPGQIGEDYRIQVEGDHIDLDLNIGATDYAIAAWSVVAILKNLASPVVFI